MSGITFDGVANFEKRSGPLAVADKKDESGQSAKSCAEVGQRVHAGLRGLQGLRQTPPVLAAASRGEALLGLHPRENCEAQGPC